MPADVQYLTVDEARAIHESLIDTSIFASDVILRLNGWRIRVEADPAHQFLIGLLERNECDFQHLLPWLRRHLEAL